MAAGYDIGASLAGSSSAGASISGAQESQGGGVTYNLSIADKGGTATTTPTSSIKTFLIVIGIVLGVGLVGYTLWKLAR